MSLGERLGFAAVAACGLAAARAALVALADGYLGAGLTDVALESFARTLVRGLPGPALGAAALALLVGRTRLLTALALAAGAALAYAFVTGRLPALPVHAPGFDSARARLAHAGAAATAIAVAVGFVVRIRPRALARLLPAAALLAAAGAAAVGFTPRERPAPVSERPNVILLSIDTLRADRLGCYGYDGGTTPALDAFAAGGVRFDRAYSPQPWTLTSHMTMLTGLSPSVHGLDRDTRLSYGVTPLALRFQRAGYATAAVVDKVAWLEPKYGFARGFHLYRRLGGQATRKTAAAEALLDDLADRPFFLFLHVFDVHSDWGKLPYDADPEDVERFAGWYDGPFDGCEGDVCASKLLQKLVEEGRSLPPEEARYVSSLYDAGLRSLDRRLAPFLARLEEDGRLDDTFVFVTSDHGEELFEHGSCLHGAFHDEVMRVPLLVRGPGVRSGASVEPAVGHVDFAPTFAELCGLDAADFQGESFATALFGPAFEGDGVALLDAKRDHYFVATADWKLLLTGRNPQLFDLRRDPGETTNLLAGERSEAIDAVFERLSGLSRAAGESGAALRERLGPATRGVTLTEHERRSLEEIGYLGDD